MTPVQAVIPPDSSHPLPAKLPSAADRVMSSSDRFFKRFINLWIVVGLGMWVVEAELTPTVQYPAIIALLSGVASRLVIWTGSIRIARYVFLFPLCIAVLVIPLTLSGVRTPILAFMTTLLILVGWMLGRRIMVAVAVMFALAIGLYWSAETHGWWAFRQGFRPSEVWGLAWTTVICLGGITMWSLIGHYETNVNHELELQQQLAQALDSAREANLKLEQLAFNDVLTGLPNRRLLLDRLKQALNSSQRQKSHGAVLFLDLNKFKQLNDTHGHVAGDQLLVEVAQRLTHAVRQSDTVARLGGDEFVILLEGLGSEQQTAHADAQAVAHKVNQSLSQPYALGAVRYTSSASIGVTLFLGDASDPEQILRQADAAMYQVKRGVVN
jgi:diguanylate cyclase (GGDEF)-like protein